MLKEKLALCRKFEGKSKYPKCYGGYETCVLFSKQARFLNIVCANEILRLRLLEMVNAGAGYTRSPFS